MKIETSIRFRQILTGIMWMIVSISALLWGTYKLSGHFTYLNWCGLGCIMALHVKMVGVVWKEYFKPTGN